MDPAAFRDHFGVEPPDIARGARLAALRFAVRDLDALQSGCSTRRGIASSRPHGPRSSSAPRPRWARPWYSSAI